MYARTHAPTRDHALRTPNVLGFLRREERGRTSVHRIRFACKLAYAHHRRPTALDCRSRERQTEPSRRRRWVPLGSPRLPPLRGVTSSPPTSAPVSLPSHSPIPPPLRFVRLFFSLLPAIYLLPARAHTRIARLVCHRRFDVAATCWRVKYASTWLWLLRKLNSDKKKIWSFYECMPLPF